MAKLAISFLLIALVLQPVLLAPTLVDSLVRSLEEKGRLNVVVTMKERTAPLLAQLSHLTSSFPSRGDRLNTVANSLKRLAAKSQENVLKALSTAATKYTPGQSFTFKSLWLTNQIGVRGADWEILHLLSHFEHIKSIEEEKVFPLDEPLDLHVYDKLLPVPWEEEESEDDVQWGVAQIEAPRVWEGGVRGEGVVVANIDTGVRVTHEALRGNFRKHYGWFDPAAKTSTPHDNQGHGTHTMGTIAGAARNVGVAPGSQWIACKGCDTSGCFLIDLLECGEWVACPTDTDGKNPDCSQAPHVVSNSWGSAQGSTWFSDTILAWRTAGIIPLFSIGNKGPACGTAGSPGDDDKCIGVGATSIDNILSNFSSVGPTSGGGRMKPDVAAPGANVLSAYYTSDTAYASMSGTSMACPHAAGTVALIISAAPSSDPNTRDWVDYDVIKSALQGGAVPTTSEGKTCSDIPDSQIPNYHVGHGRINAKQSVVRFQQWLTT